MVVKALEILSFLLGFFSDARNSIQMLMMLEMAENHSLSIILQRRGVFTMSIPIYPKYLVRIEVGIP